MEKMLTLERDNLFARWEDDRRSASPRPLRDWLAAYPDFASDLVEWAAGAPLTDYAETLPADPDGEARTLDAALLRVAEMRAAYLADTPAPLASLYEAAKANGLTPKTLAERLGVGLSTVGKLQQRLFRVASLPEALLRRLADALNVTTAQVLDYLRQPVTLAPRASYKADGVPQVAAQEEFAQAVRACRDMTDAQKAVWLALAPPEEI
jgi:transcriptional regulator with XRE-family HTH domain